jgi:RHS repeat-associated protein
MTTTYLLPTEQNRGFRLSGKADHSRMQNKISVIILYLLLSLVLPQLIFSQANIDPVKSSVSNILKKSGIVNGVALSVRDALADEEFVYPDKYHVVGRKTMVMLSAPGSPKNYIAGGWTYQVVYTIGTDPIQKTLTISSTDEGGKYVDIHEYANNASQITITVISTTGTPSGTALPEDITLELSIETERYTNLNTSAQISPFIFNPTTMKVNWGYMEGALQYELQWVFIDKNEGTTLNSYEEVFNFKEATNIIVTSNEFTIDKIYPEGAVYFRIRPIGVKITDLNQIVYGTWQFGGGNISGVEPDKTWQYVSTYAEEGKHKAVVSYYDGTLRQRQALTNLSSENITLAAETKYDYEGRKAVDILPVPLQGNNLSYQPELNRNASVASIFDKANFDKIPGSQLNNEYGVAKYYSENNDNNVDPFKNNLPDAGGYPYVQTRYLRDNTGRVSSTSGVGATFKDGSEKNNRYYYGTASSTELHRLFGSNVGEAKHYKKNMVVDPNGQISVNYLDMQGKTIATALAGSNPDNLVALSSMGNTNVTIDLNGNNVIDKDNYTSISKNTFLVNFPDEYIFTYDMSCDLVKNNILSYSLEFEISNEFDDDIQFKTQDIIIKDADGFDINYEIIGPKLIIPKINNPGTLTFTVNFDQLGAYTITKTLKLDVQEAIKNLDDNIGGTIFTDAALQALEEEYKTNMHTADPDLCNNTCTSCAAAEINQAIAEDCDIYLKDVSPGGFEYNDLEDFEFWQRVQDGLDAMLIIDNVIYTINIYKDVNGSSVRITNADEIKTLEWNPVWANELVKAHREYCQYKICSNNTNQQSKLYDQRLYAINTWEAGISSLLINPQGMSVSGIPPNTSDRDPYGQGSTVTQGALLVSALQNYKSSGKNIWTYITEFYGGLLPPPSTKPEDLADYNTMISYLNQNPTIKSERKWEMFRDAYIGLKKGIQIENSGCTCTYYIDEYARTKKDERDVNYIVNEANINDYGRKINTLYEKTLKAGCEYSSEQNIKAWMAEMAERCNFSWDYPAANAAKYSTVLNKLRTLFKDNCKLSNPMGLLDIAKASDLGLDMPDCNCARDEFADKLANQWLLKIQQHCNFNWEDYPTERSNALNALKTFFQNKYDQNKKYDNLLKSTSVSDFPSITLPAGITCSFECLFEANPYIMESKNVDVDLLNFDLENTLYLFQKPNVTWVHLTKDPTIEPWHFRIINDGSPGEGIPRKEWLAKLVNRKCLSWGNTSSWHPYNLRFPEFDKIEFYYDIKYKEYDYSRGMIYISNSSPYSVIPCKMTYADQTVELAYMIVNSKVTETRTISYPVGEKCPSLNAVPTYTEIVNKDYTECITSREKEAESQARAYFAQQIEDYSNEFLKTYIEDAFNPNFTETFNCSYNNSEYHYTLYYYDQAGNMVRTVPPAGVVPVDPGHFTSGVYDNVGEPAHILTTTYKYNSLNQVVWQETPDAGVSQFWYDSKGRLRYSQNAQQLIDGTFSYTKYDALGRVVEVGKSSQDLATCNTNIDASDGNGISQYPSTGTSEITNTYYDTQQSFFTNITQDNLRGRVASVTVSDNPANGYNYGTHYSYDIHSNVKTLVQEYTALPTTDNNRYKRVDYKYDLISGKVNEVKYQAGQPDLFYHRYEYDADNRLTNVYTSTNGIIWDQDAKYFYYQHGPLARVELGHDKVQGIDYAYTLQGWLKGVNSNTLVANRDMGKDGAYAADNPNSYIPRDAFGYSLGYFDGDYTPIGIDNGSITAATNPLAASSFAAANTPPLYNGNISNMVTVTPLTDKILPILTAYKYDQLNRITSMKAYDSPTLINSNSWSGAVNTNENYNATYNYDANGNIKELTRNGNLVSPNNFMDNLSYKYHDTKKNQLLRVVENLGVDKNGIYPDDYNETPGLSQFDAANPNTWAYNYDAIGNLVKDKSQYIDKIWWNVYGKIKEINGGASGNITYEYDGMGNRISKTVFSTGSTYYNTTWYVRDASGNILATYDYIWKYTQSGKTSDIHLKESNIYGSSRLGLIERNIDMYAATTSEISRIVGQKRYELSNHLGNVLAVITDKKIANGNTADGLEYHETLSETLTANKNAVSASSITMLPGFNTNGFNFSATIDAAASLYTYSLIASQQYYPFGSIMPGTSYNSPNYRYGFNGKEKDDDITGSTGAVYDFGDRMLDVRIGRWFSVDKSSSKFPFESPYTFVSNSPLVFIDPDGNEKIVVIGGGDNEGKDKNKFINTGLLQFNNYINLAKKGGNKEPVTIVITDIYLTDKMKGQIESIVKNASVAYEGTISLVYAKSGDDITNYINSKNTQDSKMSENRTKDQITDMTFTGHGYRPDFASQGTGEMGSFEPAHWEASGELMADDPSSRPNHNKWAWGKDDVLQLSPLAFSKSAKVTFETCNAATPGTTGVSLASFMSQKLNISVTGWYGRSDFSTIYNGEKNSKGGIRPSQSMPSAGSKYSGGTSERITYKNGKKL